MKKSTIQKLYNLGENKKEVILTSFLFDGADGDRTRDPLTASQVRAALMFLSLF